MSKPNKVCIKIPHITPYNFKEVECFLPVIGNLSLMRCQNIKFANMRQFFSRRPKGERKQPDPHSNFISISSFITFWTHRQTFDGAPIKYDPKYFQKMYPFSKIFLWALYQPLPAIDLRRKRENFVKSNKRYQNKG